MKSIKKFSNYKNKIFYLKKIMIKLSKDYKMFKKLLKIQLSIFTKKMNNNFKMKEQLKRFISSSKYMSTKINSLM